ARSVWRLEVWTISRLPSTAISRDAAQSSTDRQRRREPQRLRADRVIDAFLHVAGARRPRELLGGGVSLACLARVVPTLLDEAVQGGARQVLVGSLTFAVRRLRKSRGGKKQQDGRDGDCFHDAILSLRWLTSPGWSERGRDDSASRRRDARR